MLEIWKDITGYEGLYQVSNTGKVQSLNWRNRGLIRELTLKETQPGQFQVELSKDGKRKSFSVQSLVEAAFPTDLPAVETPKPPEAMGKTPGRPIRQLTIYGELVKQWDDVSQIYKELGYHPGTIYECCMSSHKSAYGFKWQYAV